MKRLLMIFSLFAFLLLAIQTVHAAGSTGFTLDWWTVDGGGGTFSTNGGYSLGGSIGQPDAGTASGGTYTLDGGFWGDESNTIINSHWIHLPLIMR